MSFGDRLRELRIRNGQSLQQVAYAIGASKAHIWELENNKSKNPSLDLLQKLALHFKTNISYLVEDPEGDMSKATQFFLRNSEKLAALDDRQFDVVEQLLDMIVRKNDRR
jgi:transcriptional regulator with XRE-family HTH domain